MGVPSVWCSGPVHVYLGIAGTTSNPTPVYVGTTEQGVEPEDDHRFTAVMNDLSGPEVPFCHMYSGFISRAAFVFTRYDEAAIQVLEAQPSALLGSVPGINGIADRGTMMELEGAAFPLWLSNTLPRLKAAQAAQGNGRRYASCILASPIKRIKGNRANKVVFGIMSVGRWDSTQKRFLHWDTLGLDSLPAPT